MKNFQQNSKWPIPIFDENDQPHFLFIITPPYSGSTALSELLNTSHRTMILQERGEGQWLIPGLCEEDRWNPDKKVNYDSVKAVWLNRYQMVKRLTQNIDVVIEKSPPNMMRIEKLSSLFRNYSFIANNRNPYANCSSILYRNHDVDKISSEKRKILLGQLAAKWLKRSAKIRELIQKFNIPLLTYERFCQAPSLVSECIKQSGVSESINSQAIVKVKDYKPQVISDQNDRQISRLTNKEIDHISVILKSNEQLLAFFGYQITC
jgi:hypothetical protein